MASLACILLTWNCSVSPDIDQQPVTQQVDLTILVPIHSSSLEYFDYIICYMDNMGNKQTDTVQNARPALAGNSDDFYVRTFSYNDIQISCCTIVEMVPKEGCTTVGPFIFYIPKPYIYANIYTSEIPVPSNPSYDEIYGAGSIMIDQMSVSKFQSTYGTTFQSQCRVYEGSDGIEVKVY